MGKNFMAFLAVCFFVFVLLGVSATGSHFENRSDDHENQTDLRNRNIEEIVPREATNVANTDDQTNYKLYSRTLVKRTPVGFMGMRGKKQIEFTNDFSQSQNNLHWDTTDGSSILDDTPNDLFSETWRMKKSPLAFYGVRGKKIAFTNDDNTIDSAETYYEGYLEDLMKKLKHQNRLDQLREEILQYIIDDLLAKSRFQINSDLAGNNYSNEIYKRAPSGFTGMRGKRSDDADVDTESLSEKRTSSIGNKDTLHMQFKRSPGQQFNSAFFGTRGKKQPFLDFRNKFVGVRGKKDLTRTHDDLMRQQMMPNGGKFFFNSLHDIYETDKRAPSGFMGMRGKRETDIDVHKNNHK